MIAPALAFARPHFPIPLPHSKHCEQADCRDSITRLPPQQSGYPDLGEVTSPQSFIELAGLIQLIGEAADFDAASQSALPPGIEVSHDEWAPATRRDTTDRRLAQTSLAERFADPSAGSTTTPRWKLGRGGRYRSALGAIAASGSEKVRAAKQRALSFLRAAQQAGGSWIGSSGEVHATALALRGLLAAGVPLDDDTIVAGINWLIVNQQSGGAGTIRPRILHWHSPR